MRTPKRVKRPKVVMRCWCGKKAIAVYRQRPVCKKHEWQEQTNA